MSRKIKLSELKKIVKELVNEQVEPKSDVKKTIYFGFNYPHDFIEQIFGEGDSIANHLKNKFLDIYKREGAKSAFFTFYTELDSENQKLVDDFIINNYRG